MKYQLFSSKGKLSLSCVCSVKTIVCSYHISHHLLVHQVFKNLDFLGWYTTGSGPTENDIRVHKQVNRKERQTSAIFVVYYHIKI